MRSTYVVAALIFTALGGCQTAPSHQPAGSGKDNVTFSGGDGRTKQTAIVVNATNDFAGTDAIHEWLREHCNCKVTGQALITDPHRTYDLMSGEHADGSKVEYYFDITESFGKW